MEPARLLVVLIAQFASVWADPRVTQDPLTGPVALGETVKLKCNLHGASAGTYGISWVRQAPGKTPQGVLYHATDRKIYRAPGITDRFTPSAQDSSFTYYLTVGNVEAADGAVYYCMVWISNVGYYTGNGTPLDVKSSAALPPSVTVFPPSEDELSNSGTATLSCLVSGFKPGFVNVEWSSNGAEISSGASWSPVTLEAEGTHRLASYLRLPSSDWQAGRRYACRVRHQAQAQPIERSLSSATCDA
ncbi:immunoglobulin lambda-1 light chain-like isoform X1 [Scyliorhinus canicula]|uniref:immunoglobulin lambda-1 light chain-like isoform X1 n=1 Tax=Scyliorhinus canicula TaxID=7830 RepID=UPI0018F58496|nr:immunoglobulin lambda-1 light chain-like isoform X1 [Scyliorhinus canicula]